MSQTSSNAPQYETVVLDIDECLVRGIEVSKHPETVEVVRKACAKKPHLRQRCFSIVLDDGVEYLIIKRPHLDQFLNCAFRLFRHVVVWSAARNDYVNKVVAYLFKHDHQMPDVVFSRDEIVGPDHDYHKPLDRLERDNADVVNYRSLFFLDDKADNFRTNPNNGITIPVYRPSSNNPLDDKDDAFLRLIEWLMQPMCLRAHDVRTIDKSNVFEIKYSGRYDKLMKCHKRFLVEPACNMSR
jgi:TFIIF-interacting CTD phosphatase-like protein